MFSESTFEISVVNLPEVPLTSPQALASASSEKSSPKAQSPNFSSPPEYRGKFSAAPLKTMLVSEQLTWDALTSENWKFENLNDNYGMTKIFYKTDISARLE